MNAKEWASLKFFAPTENWGNPGLMRLPLLQELELFRELLGVPVVVTCGTQGEHAKGSSHYLGEAVDLVAPRYMGSLFDLYTCASRLGFTGLGLYRDWCFNGNTVGGLHLELSRPSPHRKLWLCTTDQGVQVYHAFNEENLVKLKFIGG